MKTNQERTESINRKVKSKLYRRKVWITCVSVVCVFAIAITVCSVPLLGGGGVPDINAYKNDAYYPLISKINAFTYRPTPKMSVFQALAAKFRTANDLSVPEDMLPVPDASDKPATDANEGGNKYQETTLNQVDGVIEGDILKRSDKNVFYLKNAYFQQANGKDDVCFELSVYDINKSDTQRISTYRIKSDNSVGFSMYGFSVCNGEMYLSGDASTLTVIAQCRAGEGNAYDPRYVCIIALDVTDVSHIMEIGRKYVSGRYVSSRKTDSGLLVVTNFSVNAQLNYADKSTYVPSCGDSTDSYIPIRNIALPQDVTDCDYTVIAQFDEATQEVKSQYALFSYTSDIFVSQDNIFAFRTKTCLSGSTEHYDQYRNPDGLQGVTAFRNVSEITQLSYKNGIEKVSQFCVDGTLKDQYSLDEKDGVLRAVTTTRKFTRYYGTVDYDAAPIPAAEIADYVSASLYCVDLATQKTVAVVSNFAPRGETVRAVRFDGNFAYVCTAIEKTDPVFTFDLSDYNNVTVKDTGVITGFSFSLVPFGGVTLGIGVGSGNTVKIEAYAQTDDAVVSAGSYEWGSSYYSQDYKAHFVDAERQLVGLQLGQYVSSDYPDFSDACYVLLHYDAEKQSFGEVAVIHFDSPVDLARAFYCDNGVYVFGRNDFRFVDLQKAGNE